MDPVFLIPLSAILMPIVLVPTILILRHIGRRREWEHKERMRALELGLAPPGDDSWRAKVCIAIGAAVPLGGFFLAWLASPEGRASGDLWGVAGTVGGLAVVSGSMLAVRLLPPRDRSDADGPRESVAAGKRHAFDPDAYDVAGRRG